MQIVNNTKSSDLDVSHDIAKDPEAIQKYYQQEAINRNIKPLEAGLFLIVDGEDRAVLGEQLAADFFKIPKVPDALSPEGFLERHKVVGCYNLNNGVIGLINEKGQMLIGGYTEENIKALNEAGYKGASFGIPFSNGEIPTDKAAQIQFHVARTYWNLQYKWEKIPEPFANQPKPVYDYVARIAELTNTFPSNLPDYWSAIGENGSKMFRR